MKIYYINKVEKLNDYKLNILNLLGLSKLLNFILLIWKKMMVFFHLSKVCI